jgi:hypothetical protein
MAKSSIKGLPAVAKKAEAGQTLFEVLVGITIGAIIIGGATGVISLSLRSSLQNKSYQVVASLNQELADNVTVFAEANWRNIYDLSKSPAQYYLTATSTGFVATSGAENIVADGTAYARSFTVENVNRDANGNIADSGTDDPSTQKITVTTSFNIGGEPITVSFIKYLSRHRNLIFRQTDWSGGPGEEGPLTVPNNRFATSTNIDSTSMPGAIKIQGL